MLFYVVQPGDTVYSIASMTGNTVEELLRNNGLTPDSVLVPGQALVLAEQEEERTQKREISVNGYAYPYIDNEVLQKTLPDLTYVTLFTYGFTEEGELISIQDEPVIGEAKEAGVAPLMLLSTLTGDGTFSNELASRIFSDEAARNRLFDQVLQIMRTKGYYGLDVDFEFILPEDKDNYVLPFRHRHKVFWHN